MTMPLIALIEDNHEIVGMLDQLLRGEGYAVISYGRGKDADQFILRTLPDLVILDLWLQDLDASGMLARLDDPDPLIRQIPVIICSAHVAVLSHVAESFRARGYRVVPKPFQPDVLLSEIQLALAEKGNPLHPRESVGATALRQELP